MNRAASARRARRNGLALENFKAFRNGTAQETDIDLLMDIANNIEGNTICALGDAAAWPVQSMIRRFRHEFEKRVSKAPSVTRTAVPVAS